MREIKFRGLSKGLNEWTYGYYNACAGSWGEINQFISYPFSNGILVDENTIGQYTGIKDKNDKEIYEGDIVLCERNIEPSIDKYTYIVRWNAEDARYNFIYKDGWSEIDACDHIFMEVIGNIYENPELLEVAI